MGRTGFLPPQTQQPGATSLVSQGGSQVGQVGLAGGRPASEGAGQNTDTPKGGWQAQSASSPKAAAAANLVSIVTKLIGCWPGAQDMLYSVAGLD